MYIYLFLNILHTKRLLIINPATSPPITAQAAPIIEYRGTKIKHKTKAMAKFKLAQGKNCLNFGEFWMIFPGKALRKKKTKEKPRISRTGEAGR